MKKIFAPLVFALAVTGPVFAAPPEAWEYSRSIDTGGIADRPAAVELSPEIAGAAREDLADVRIFKGAAEVPFVLRRQTATSETKEVASSVVSKEMLEAETVMVLDLGENRKKYNQITLIPKQTRFFRTVLIEGSDDLQAWNVVRKGMIVQDLQYQERMLYFRGLTYDSAISTYGYFRSSKLNLAFPETSYRYLRVTVPHGDGDPVELISARVDRDTTAPALETPYPGTVTKTEISEDGKSVDLTVDLGNKNLPVSRVDIESPETNYLRQVDVSTSDDAKEWSRQGSGTIFSISVEGEKSSNKTISLSGAKTRYLKIKIHNRDDKPLKVSQVRATGLKQYAVFIPSGGEYSIAYGNPDAEARSYDLQQVLRGNKISDFVTASVGPEVKNPGFVRTKNTAPWTTKPVILWIAMGVVMLGIVGLALQLIKKADAGRP